MLNTFEIDTAWEIADNAIKASHTRADVLASLEEVKASPDLVAHCLQCWLSLEPQREEPTSRGESLYLNNDPLHVELRDVPDSVTVKQWERATAELLKFRTYGEQGEWSKYSRAGGYCGSFEQWVTNKLAQCAFLVGAKRPLKGELVVKFPCEQYRTETDDAVRILFADDPMTFRRTLSRFEFFVKGIEATPTKTTKLRKRSQ